MEKKSFTEIASYFIELQTLRKKEQLAEVFVFSGLTGVSHFLKNDIFLKDRIESPEEAPTILSTYIDCITNDKEFFLNMAKKLVIALDSSKEAEINALLPDIFSLSLGLSIEDNSSDEIEKRKQILTQNI